MLIQQSTRRMEIQKPATKGDFILKYRLLDQVMFGHEILADDTSALTLTRYLPDPIQSVIGRLFFQARVFVFDPVPNAECMSG